MTETPPVPTTAGSVPSLPEHYEFRSRLGEGGYGEVYEAWDTKLRRCVAIKCIKLAASGAAGANLLREARLAASLRHPTFVKIHAIEETAESQFIVMELVPGQTLKALLANGPVDATVAIQWIRQLARAMQEAHASGLVHGDLKPSNIMVEPEGQLRILDFGLAARDDAMATTSLPEVEAQGTIAYMAPERLLGKPATAQGDVYALGAIFYEMLCGARPFASLSGLALAAALMQSSSDSWPYPEELGTPLIGVIRAMTARQPEQRLRSMDEVLQRLALMSDVTGPLPLLPPVATPRRWSPRALKIGGAVLVVTCLAGGAWLMAPYYQAIRQTLTPFSESLEMRQGLEALHDFDRPGNLDAAAQHFQRILDRTPDHAAAVAGMSLTDSMRFAVDNTSDEIWRQRAEAGAQQALKLNSQLGLSHAAAGWVSTIRGHYDEALNAYERSLLLDPDNFLALFGKLRALRKARHYDQAKVALADAQRRFPQERGYVDEDATLAYEQGDYVKAEQGFRHSIALQPDAVTAYANLNAVLLRQNRSDEASRVVQQGLQVRPSAKLYTSLGNVLFQHGDYVGAADAFEHAVDPKAGAPGVSLNWANLGDALLWIPGREQKARQAFAKARELLAPRLARSPDDVLSLSRMALYSARIGDKTEAMKLMARALELAPKNADVHFRAGLAYELLSQRAMALDAIAKARALGYPAKAIDTEPTLMALRRDPAYRAE